MPGIFGYVRSSKLSASRGSAVLKSMQTTDYIVAEPLLIEASTVSGGVRLQGTGSPTPSFVSDRFTVWLDGEIYNFEEARQSLAGIASLELCEALAFACEQDVLAEFLNQCKGYFCAAVVDKVKDKVHLCSDRFGLRLLYMYHHEGQFAWGSELKAFLPLKELDLSLSADHLHSFVEIGHYFDDQTPFQHINLMPPASIITFDLTRLTASHQFYWTWNNLKLLDVNEKEALPEIHKRFLQAVERRYKSEPKPGIALSGGLDSRAILAAVKQLYPDSHGYAYTFGTSGCADIAIATEVALKAGWDHEVFHFNAENWLERRLAAVWRTDGMKDVKHMHGIEFQEQVRTRMESNLNGFLGGGVMGGVYIPIARGIEQEHWSARKHRKLYKQYFSRSVNSEYTGGRYEIAVLMNRARRLINMGTINNSSFVAQVKPFFDDDLLLYMMSLPVKLRKGHNLYSAMLQRYFPDYFTTIPWAQTGKPTAPAREATLYRRGAKKAIRLIRERFGKQPAAEYTQYARWICNNEVSTRLTTLLCNPKALYRSYFATDVNKTYLQPHLKNPRKDYSDTILRFVTIEVYLQSIKEHCCNDD